MPKFSLVDQSLLETLSALNKRYGKHYSFPSQEKLQELLNRQYGLKRCRRCLNYHMAELEKQDFIRRTRRIRRNSAGQMITQSTIYVITKRALAYLGKLAGRVARAGIRPWRSQKEKYRQDYSADMGRLLLKIGMPLSKIVRT